MRVIGLTGSIGMGKSTAAAMLRRMRIPVYCADEAVHELLQPHGAAVVMVAKLYPPSYEPLTHSINRAVLGKAVFHDTALMEKLEAILHPLARLKEKKFLQYCRAMRKSLVVLDIPLLFETRGERRVDAVMVVSAPPFIQRQRVLARAGMTKETFLAILNKQIPDAQKRRRSDIAIPTGLGRAVTYARLRKVCMLACSPNMYQWEVGACLKQVGTFDRFHKTTRFVER